MENTYIHRVWVRGYGYVREWKTFSQYVLRDRATESATATATAMSAEEGEVRYKLELRF